MQKTLEVDLLAHTQVTESWKDYWKAHGGIEDVVDGQAVALTAIRTCYSPLTPFEIVLKEGKKYFNESAADGGKGTEADRLLRHIMKSGHTSTIEHLSFTFMISGLSRAALAQLTRHRVGFSYSVQSQRFVKFGSGDKSGGFDYVIPESIKKVNAPNPEILMMVFEEMMRDIQVKYDYLRDQGVSAEDARSILPQAAACNLTMTANLRSIIDFYRKRGPHTHAQAEIQDLAVQMREAVTEAEPWTDMFFGEGAE
ncbi:FAD-dependent thymidylate synthase [uncultured Exiguobacterium sp.]|uniref:FAD-dependent thymidylate synthase n=1 Tax=uncultured Exiguobacterium sp. TaxID=202669 RepID=UPI0025F09DF4|nr:FAD-dependent thymidylate synthase [uncultured Exiguobacterium sp.]